MISSKNLLIAASMLFMALAFAHPNRAFGMDESNWPTRMSFNEPFQVGDMVLSPGTYEFCLTPSLVSRSVVMIYSVDNRRWEGMVMGINDYRMDTSKMSGFTFILGEKGTPKKLEYWFYPGWLRGVKFIYSDRQTADTMTAAMVSAVK
jgi:hypothetical protein